MASKNLPGGQQYPGTRPVAGPYRPQMNTRAQQRKSNRSSRGGKAR